MVEVLWCNVVDIVYCIFGESYLLVFDVLYDVNGICIIVICYEGVVLNMVDVYGKLIGWLGICFVICGFGVIYVVNGVYMV